MSIINLHDKSSALKRPLILDGAMGSLLQQRGFHSDKYLWYSKLNLDNPNEIIKIHKEYINAGAEIITTNTFRTNPVAVKRSNYQITTEQLVAASLKLAHQSIENDKIIIAGSNPPAEDCYQSERTITKFELEYNHKKHIELLWENKVDIIWNETQSHWDEIDLICKFCSNNSLPFTMNIYFTESMRILSGEPINEAVSLISDYQPQVIGFNCIRPETFLEYSEKYSLPTNNGFYFNCGAGEITDPNITCGIDPTQNVEYIKKLIKYNPTYVGSCCGSSPIHIKKIKEYFDEVYRN